MKAVFKLTSKEKKMFDSLARFLVDQNHLQSVDSYTLSLCVRTWSMLEDSLEKLEEKGPVQTFSNGTRQISPERVVYEHAEKGFLNYVNQFGLSPRARRALMAQIASDNPADDPFEYMPGTGGN